MSQNSSSDSRGEGRPPALLGSAKIDIQHLQLQISALGAARGKLGKDEKNIQRLQNIFLLDECRRGDPENRVPVLVGQEDLREILRLNNVKLSDLQGPSLPHLKIVPQNVGLLCLHGYHRLYAGQRYLGPRDQWWGVNLYSKEGTTNALLRKLTETGSKAKPDDDGTIFYRLRTCQLLNDKSGVRKWKAKFHASKLRDYKQLQRQEELRKAFDDLLVMPGFWPQLLFGTFHRILTMRCPEEFICYLQGVKSQWQPLFTEDEHRALVDHVSIAMLEGRSPFYSLQDAAFIRNAYECGELFINLPQQARTQALSEVLKCPQVMLTLQKFIEDTKWLEPASKIVRGLLPATFRGTIRQGLYEHFHPPSQFSTLDQRGEEDYVAHVSKDMAFSDAYRRVWAFALRNFPYMGHLQPRQTTRYHKIDKKNQAECWYHFAELAYRLGFSTPVIEEISRASSWNSAVAVDALTCAKPSAFYHVSSNFVQDNASHMVQILEPVKARADLSGAPELTSDVCQKWRLSMRCGRPYDQAFKQNERYGYLKYIYGQTTPIPRQTITHFAVFRDTFHAFFASSPDIPLYPMDIDKDDNQTDFASPMEVFSTMDFPEMTQPPTSDAEARAQRDADIQRRQQEESDRQRRQQENEKVENERLRTNNERLRCENERLEQERNKKVRLEQERSEQERIENGKIENERLRRDNEQLRLQNEQLAQTRVEQEQLAQKRLAQKQLAQKQLAQEQVEQEQVEQKRVEKEQLRREIEELVKDRQRLETERLQLQTKEKEMEELVKDRQRLETERLQLKEMEEAEYRKHQEGPARQQQQERSERPMAHQQQQERQKPLTKRRLEDPSGRDGKHRINPPQYSIIAGGLREHYLQIVLHDVAFESLLKNYSIHKKAHAYTAKCVIRICPADKKDTPHLFFFAGNEQGRIWHNSLIEELSSNPKKYTFFDIDPSCTSLINTNPNSPDLWSHNFLIAKPLPGKSRFEHPNPDYNLSLWPWWSANKGFEIDARIEPRPEQKILHPTPTTAPSGEISLARDDGIITMDVDSGKAPEAATDYKTWEDEISEIT